MVSVLIPLGGEKLEARPMATKQDLDTLLWRKLFMETPSGNLRVKQSLGMSSVT